MADMNLPDFDSLVPAAALTCRGFVVSVLASGFALAVRPLIDWFSRNGVR